MRSAEGKWRIGGPLERDVTVPCAFQLLASLLLYKTHRRRARERRSHDVAERDGARERDNNKAPEMKDGPGKTMERK